MADVEEGNAILKQVQSGHVWAGLEAAGRGQIDLRKVILAAAESDSHAMEWATPELCADRAFVLSVAERGGFVLQYVCEDLACDREVVMESVKHHAIALAHAKEKFRADKEVVWHAVNCNWDAIRSAHESLRADRNFMFEVMKINAQALQFANDDIRGDPWAVLRAIRADQSTFRFCRPMGLARRPEVRAAIDSYLACPGDPVPILVATLQEAPDEIICKAHLMSARSLGCSLPLEATVSELAEVLHRELAEPAHPRIHILLEGRDEPLSPFDAVRAVRDFLA